jgi:VanZ family protein
MFKRLLTKSWPAALMMAAIFAVSSRPADTLPNLGWADAFIKKGGHVLGYATLAVAYWRALGWSPGRTGLAWALAVLYGITDEVHQLFVAGRGASAGDVALFDASGAILGLWLAGQILLRSRT